MGLLLNSVSSFTFSLVSLFIKLCTKSGIGAFEVVLGRNVVQFVLCLLWLGAARVNPIGPRSSWMLLWLRGIVGVLSMSMWMMAIKMLPLADAVIINFLSPIFTAVFGFFILKEKITRIEIGGYFLCFAGIVFIARPPFLFGKLANASGNDIPWQTRLAGVGIGMGSSVCAGMAYVLTRKIGKAVHPYVVVNYLSVCGIVLPPLGIWVFESFVMPKGIVWLYLAAVGVLGFGAQGFLTVALQVGRAARVAVASYLQIVFAFIWSFCILGETPSWLSGIGTVCILGNAVIAAWKAWVSARPTANAVAPPAANVDMHAVDTSKHSIDLKRDSPAEEPDSVEMSLVAGAQELPSDKPEKQ
eukprot:m51a1_g99 hypothetical protein (357) ;mRNA; r:308870-310336